MMMKRSILLAGDYTYPACMYPYLYYKRTEAHNIADHVSTPLRRDACPSTTIGIFAP